jgi:hypothetical protein
MEKGKSPWLKVKQSSKPKPKTKNSAKNYRVAQPHIISMFFMVFGSLVQTSAQREATKSLIVAIN